jgi:hypothetical protein
MVMIEMEDAKPDGVVEHSGEWIDLGVGNETPRHRGLRFPAAGDPEGDRAPYVLVDRHAASPPAMTATRLRRSR